MLEELFHYYVQHPDKIGQQSRERIEKQGLHRAICDYLAGMTDRYLIHEYERTFALRMARNAPPLPRARAKSPRH
jgi:dGTPase